MTVETFCDVEVLVESFGFCDVVGRDGIGPENFGGVDVDMVISNSLLKSSDLNTFLIFHGSSLASSSGCDFVEFRSSLNRSSR